MPCQISSGYPRKQCNSAGGVKNIYVANFSDVQSVTISSTNPAEATAIAMATGKKFYRIEVEPEVANFTITRQVNPQGRTIFYEVSLSFNVPVQTADDVLWIDTVSRGVTVFIVEMNDGTRRLIGHEYGCTASGDEQSGTALGDPHVANLTFTTKNVSPVPFYTGDMAGLLA